MGLFHLAFPQVWSTSNQVSDFPFFFRLNNILLYVYITLCSSIHPLMYTCVISTCLAIVNNTAVQVSVWVPAFNSFGYIFRSGIAGPYGSSMFSFLRNHQTAPPFFLFKAASVTYGSSRARGWIGAATASLGHSHSNRIWAVSSTYTSVSGNAGSLTHWARPGIEPASSWILVGFLTHWATVGTLDSFACEYSYSPCTICWITSVLRPTQFPC